MMKNRKHLTMSNKKATERMLVENLLNGLVEVSSDHKILLRIALFADL